VYTVVCRTICLYSLKTIITTVSFGYHTACWSLNKMTKALPFFFVAPLLVLGINAAPSSSLNARFPVPRTLVVQQGRCTIQGYATCDSGVCCQGQCWYVSNSSSYATILTRLSGRAGCCHSGYYFCNPSNGIPTCCGDSEVSGDVCSTSDLLLLLPGTFWLFFPARSYD
jgi:hypothetical protein